MESQSVGGKYKKKKKMSYMQKMKKFGKSGRFGQGRQVDKETYDYFLRVMEANRNGFDDDEEAKAAFVANVFCQTEGSETELCGNQLVSRVIEDLLPLAKDEVRRRFMEAMVADLRVAATDAFASHVIEKLLFLAAFGKEDSDSDFAEYSSSWVIRVAKFTINNLDEFAFDRYASHIIRTCLQCAAGVRVPENVARSKKATGGKMNEKTDEQEAAPLKEGLAVLELACEKIEGFEDKKSFVGSDISSGIVQTLILVLSKRKPETCERLCTMLVDDVLKPTPEDELEEEVDPRLLENIDKQEKEEKTDKDDDEGPKVPAMFEFEPVCRTVEAVISLRSEMPGISKKLYENILEGRLLSLSLHPTGNYIIQKLLSSCQDKAEFDAWFEKELDAGVEDILAAGNTGVVLAVAQTCRRLATKQHHFMGSLMNSLHCSSDHNKLIPLLIRMVTKEAFEEDKGADDSATAGFSVHIHGSLIVQELLRFQKPIKAVSSMLSMSASSLRDLLCDPKGCHVSDAFAESDSVGEKSRDGLVKALKGELVALACSKHGSRSLDAMWLKASAKGREWIAAELAEKESALNASQFGRFFAQKCALSTFKRARGDWAKALDQEKKNREVFSDIIDIAKPKKTPIVEDTTAASPNKAPSLLSPAYLDGRTDDTFELPAKNSKVTEKPTSPVDEEEQMEAMKRELKKKKKKKRGKDEAESEKEDSPPPAKKAKKKKKAKSYLDDL